MEDSLNTGAVLIRGRESMSVKEVVFEILEAKDTGNRLTRAFSVFMVSLITLNVVAVVLDTVESISLEFGSQLRLFEIVSVVIFTLEYILRIWSCAADRRFTLGQGTVCPHANGAR